MITKTTLWTCRFKGGLREFYQYVSALPSQGLCGSAVYEATWTPARTALKVVCVRYTQDAPDDRFQGRGMVA